jgi:hypothetical protein
MAITTYAELKTAIANWLNRDDLTSAIPDFITSAEAQMQRDVRHYKMMQRSTAPIDSRYTAVPPTWLETVRFHLVGDKSYRLELTSMDDMLQLREERGGTSGRPTHYAHIGDSLEVFPTPDAEYDAELLYYEKIPVLSDSNTTNWLLEFAPDLYLYGSLVHSAPYLKDDERIQVWATLYTTALQGLNNQSESARFGGSGIRMRVRAY